MCSQGDLRDDLRVRDLVVREVHRREVRVAQADHVAETVDPDAVLLEVDTSRRNCLLVF